MLQDYRTLTTNIQNRLNPESLGLEKSLREDLSSITYSDVLQFVRTAMAGVDAAYTERSKAAGESVKDHLRKELSDVSYRYQGSVMTNTHVKGFSDIDLVVISDKFFTYAKGDASRYLGELQLRSQLTEAALIKLRNEVDGPSYTGNKFQDLRDLRVDSERLLEKVYTECDIEKPKSIKIRNKNLHRDVDIVIANWYDDVRSIIYDKGLNRGIEIYNKATGYCEDADYPFVSIEKINARGAQTNDRLKKMIRFLKNVRSFSTLEIDLSSFDINACCYDISVDKYQSSHYLNLVGVLYNQLASICGNVAHADSIVSVDEREYIFRHRPAKIENLKKLLSEVQKIYIDTPNLV